MSQRLLLPGKHMITNSSLSDYQFAGSVTVLGNTGKVVDTNRTHQKVTWMIVGLPFGGYGLAIISTALTTLLSSFTTTSINTVSIRRGLGCRKW